jgi:hypothetical protein
MIFSPVSDVRWNQDMTAKWKLYLEEGEYQKAVAVGVSFLSKMPVAGYDH